MSSLVPSLFQTALARLMPILNGLSTAVFGQRESPVMGEALSRLLWMRILQVAAELRALVAALEAGTLRVRRSPEPGLRRRPAATPALRLPRRFGWLLPLMQPTAAIYGGYIRALLEEPEMAALLAASPRAVRAIRPLCRILGVTMPVPPAPVPPAPVPPAPPAEPRDDAESGVTRAACSAETAPLAASSGAVRNEQASQNLSNLDGPSFCTHFVTVF